MGTSRDAAEFVRKINNLGTATERERTTAVAKGALTAKTTMLGTAAVKGVTPGGQIAGRKWGVSYNLREGRQASALVRFTGAFHLVNNDTKPHLIRPRVFAGTRGSVAGRRGRGRRAVKGAALLQLFGVDARDGGALKIPGVGFRADADHPGTKGKGIFQAARLISGEKVPRVMADSMKGAWKRALG